MASKTLSVQLCEVCGIEPLNDENAYFTGNLGKYPDFENKNFAKLFNMITTIEDFSFSTGLYYIPYIPSYRQLTRLSTPEGDYESENIDPIKAFLTCVFKCCCKEKGTADYIRRTKWEI